MKKYHGQQLTTFIPDFAANPANRELTQEQFQDLDLWTVPRGVFLRITGIPFINKISVKRTTKALRFNLYPAHLSKDELGHWGAWLSEDAFLHATEFLDECGEDLQANKRRESTMTSYRLCRHGAQALKAVTWKLEHLIQRAHFIIMDLAGKLASKKLTLVGEA